MIKNIRYFHAVVDRGSFSRAARECYISQSAISQRMQTLEREVGAKLLERQGRKAGLTDAGRYFYEKTKYLLADYDSICHTAREIASRGEKLTVGCLRGFCGPQFNFAVSAFMEKYPDTGVEIRNGNHEELYHGIENGIIDIALNDQRRVFSSEYMNVELTTVPCYAEISERNPLSALPSLDVSALSDMACVIVCSREQQLNERGYCHDIFGLKNNFIFAETLEQARLQVAADRGFMPLDCREERSLAEGIARVPLFRGGKLITRKYCAFMRNENPSARAREFATILKNRF